MPMVTLQDFDNLRRKVPSEADTLAHYAMVNATMLALEFNRFTPRYGARSELGFSRPRREQNQGKDAKVVKEPGQIRLLGLHIAETKGATLTQGRSQ
jgi:hypothetical protein